jgi:hypothetical protein
VPFALGLTAVQAALARRLSGLGWLAPMPAVLFQNRADSLIGGLLDCKQVVAGSTAEVELLAAAGIPRRILSAAPSGLLAELLPATGLAPVGAPGHASPG